MGFGRPAGRAEEFWFEALEAIETDAAEGQLIDVALERKGKGASFLMSWLSPERLVPALVRALKRFSISPPLAAALGRWPLGPQVHATEH